MIEPEAWRTDTWKRRRESELALSRDAWARRREMNGLVVSGNKDVRWRHNNLIPLLLSLIPPIMAGLLGCLM